MTNEDALLLLADSVDANTRAIRAVSVALSALRDTLLFHHPEMADDYATRLDSAEKAHDKQFSTLRKQIDELPK
jgi:hypothetical protein